MSSSLTCKFTEQDDSGGIPLLRRLAKATQSLSTTDRRDLMKTAEAGQKTNHAKAQAVIAASQGGPALRMTSSDGTPVQLKKKVVHHQVNSSETVTRIGKETHEFLVAHAFLWAKIREAGAVTTAMMFKDPQPLTWGKAVVNQVEVVRNDLP